MTGNDSNSYPVVNKLVDKYNNTYYCSICKKPVDTDHSALIQKLKRILKLLNLKLRIESG